MSISQAAARGDKLSILVALRDRLASEIDACDRMTILPALVNQLRSTLDAITVEVDRQVETSDPAEDQLAAARSARAARAV